MSGDRITLAEDRERQFKRASELNRIMSETKSIPEYLTASAEFLAIKCRREILKLKDILRKYPDSKTEQALIELAKEQLKLYETDIAEMKEFYGQ